MRWNIFIPPSSIHFWNVKKQKCGITVHKCYCICLKMRKIQED